MTGQVLERDAASILVIIIPLALGIVVVNSAWPVLLAIAFLAIGLKLWQKYQWQRWSEQVNPFFNQLLKENQGCLTAIDLSLTANLTPEAARRFLETKANEYGAQRKNYENKGTVYYFLTASALGEIFDRSEPLISKDNEALSKKELNDLSSFPDLGDNVEGMNVLIQAELAKRLEVHSGTISKRKADPDFSQWTQGKDPEGIAWQYAPKQKVFVPLKH